MPDYRVTPEGWWWAANLAGCDQHDRIEQAEQRGWRAVPAWGADRGDLGSRPPVVLYLRERAGYELALSIEGVVEQYRFPTAEERSAEIDRRAFSWWQLEAWVADLATTDDVPAGHQLRGPYRPASSAVA